LRPSEFASFIVILTAPLDISWPNNNFSAGPLLGPPTSVRLCSKTPLRSPFTDPSKSGTVRESKSAINKHWIYDRSFSKVPVSARTSGMAKRVALYLQISTGEQTTMNQRSELQAWAARCGHVITEVYEDHAVSGAKSSDRRPALSRLLKDAVRRRFDTWWRCGRSTAWGAA
jgi:Resolvase, N terminal domain